MSRYAVVVGINRYIGFNALNHAVNDAVAVKRWLVERGGVPEAQVKLITSAADGSLDEDNPRPLAYHVSSAIGKWRDAAAKGVQDGSFAWEDTRLYVYVSGHGLAPTPDDAALLGADATRRNTSSISLLAVREFLRLSKEFREIVLLADCCRDDVPGAPTLAPPWTETRTLGRGDVRHLFWRATGFGRKSFEAPALVDHPEEEHGYFTRALLAGLNGPAARNGRIEALDLADWLERELPGFLPAGRKQEPDLPLDTSSKSLLFWSDPAAQAAPAAVQGDAEVELEVRSGAGVTITVLDAGGEIVAKGKVRLTTTVSPGPCSVLFRDATGERRVQEDVQFRTVIQDPGATPNAIVPFDGSAGQNESHQQAADELARGMGVAGDTGLVVIVRLRRDDVSAIAPTLTGLTFRGNPLQVDRRVPEEGQPRLVGAAVPCGPGPCTLTFPARALAGGSFARALDLSLFMHAGWVTSVFAPPDVTGRAVLGGVSIRMRRPNAADAPGGDLAAEYALDALARGVAGIPAADLQYLLYGKWENPFFGLVGAHLLLLEDQVRWSLLVEVLTNLRALIPENPDLTGLLGLAARRWADAPDAHSLPPPQPPAAVASLPLLWRSWEGLLWLDRRTPGFLTPQSAAESRAADVMSEGPWLAVPEIAAQLELAEQESGASARVRAWASAAGTRDPVQVAAGTRLPVRLVREILDR